jgi:outer membrane protein TolC
VLERVQQNAVSAAFNWPLDVFGQVGDQSGEARAVAAGLTQRAAQVRADLKRDWQKSDDRLKSLLDQKNLDETAARDAESLSQLVYSAYKNGSSSLLEVQTAQLKALEAKVRQTQTDAQFLVERAYLEALSE